jgi:hypothetical protein
MLDNEHKYISILKKAVFDKISADINKMGINSIVEIDLIKSHIDNTASANFQDYYFTTLDNEQQFYNSSDFFRQFKKRYALQGIDNNYLDRLEMRKKEILTQIRADSLAQLYFATFNKAEIKHGNGIKEKDLGSFFVKLVHTFRPNDYCALDNPIKNYFGLKKESFFISFLIISEEYKHWALENNKRLMSIREKFKQADKRQIIKHDNLTDMKLLDLIFWSKANRNQKKSGI